MSYYDVKYQNESCPVKPSKQTYWPQLYLTQYSSVCYNSSRNTILSYYEMNHVYVLYDYLAPYDELMRIKAEGDCSQRREGMTLRVSLFDLLLPL